MMGTFAQSLSAAALEISASKTVCGQVWLDNYDLLNKKKKINIQFPSSSSVYRLGDGRTFNATKMTQLPLSNRFKECVVMNLKVL